MAIQVTAPQISFQSPAVDLGGGADKARVRDTSAPAITTVTADPGKDVVVSGSPAESEAIRASLQASGADAAGTARRDINTDGSAMRIGTQARLAESTQRAGEAKGSTT